MSEKPLELIEKYLDRVRVYLPIDSEESLIEIRTHLLEEAESIGDGSITRGSAMMAIERFGDPKDAANALAGTGKRVGPVPTEYTQPLIRMITVIVAIAAAFLVGAYVIGLTFPDWFNFTNYPIAIPFVILQIVIYSFIIVGVIYLVKRETAPTEIGIAFKVGEKYRYFCNITLFNLTFYSPPKIYPSPQDSIL